MPDTLDYIISNSVMANKNIMEIKESLVKQNKINRHFFNATTYAGLGLMVSGLCFFSVDKIIKKMNKDVTNLQSEVIDLKVQNDCLEKKIQKLEAANKEA